MRFASSLSNSCTSRNVSMCRSGSTSRCTGAFGLMSSMATNPSPALTCSPSRTSLQKRQSGCDANDSLLGDVVRLHPHELPLRAVDEPGRIVVAVASPRTVDQHRLLVSELSGPPATARLRREGAEPGTPLLLYGGRYAVVIRGAGSGPR